MKKNLFIIAAAATLLAACAEKDTFRDLNSQEGNENGGAIAFTSFTDKVTKGTAENSEALYTWTFYEHQETFKIWARKAEQPTNEIFGGSIVTVAPAAAPAVGYTYTYAPARFWDKTSAKYHFYAAAPAEPADGIWSFHGSATEISDLASLGNGYFTTSSALNGVNLKSVTNGGPDGDLDNIFKTATLADGTTKDIDKLIAAPCEVTNTYYNKATPEAVNLNFIHILSKLNVTISTSLYDATNPYDVDLLAFEVHNIPSTGNFDESTAGFTEHGKNIRWTLTGSTTTDILTGIDNSTNKVNVANPAAANETGAKTYIVESLIIPQEIEYERVALDGQAHAEVNENAVPFASYEEYTQARHDDVTRLTEAQFNALFTGTGAGRTFIEWSNYVPVTGETDANAIDENTFNSRIEEATKIPAINIPAYSAPTKPYFVITYSIDGDEFTQYFNLAAAFLNYTNNSKKYDANGDLVDLTTEPTTFDFYEGWQNTLNIIINPTKIEFTADVATWSENENIDYEIEQGNENPNTNAPANP